jgi:hypothetical protein
VLLAAWTSANRVTYLDLQTGTQQGDRTLEDPPSTDRAASAWADMVKSLAAPNGAALPVVRFGGITVSASADGTTRLYQTAPAELYLAAAGGETRLELDPTTVIINAAIDRAGGLVAALDADAKLHLFQGKVRVGAFETGLHLDDEFRPALALGASTLFLSDGHTVACIDFSGQVRKRFDLHYTLGAIACSPDGSRFVASDLDDNVVRIYDGDLQPTHQRHAVDLLAEAKRSQLLASSGASSAALGPLAIASKGALAFALSGTLCVTSLARLKAHPRPTL